MDFYKGDIPIINDSTDEGFFRPAGVGFGCVPRDYSVQPQPMLAQPSQMQLIPESEWDARYDEQEARQSSLEHVYLSGPGGTPIFEHLDQNGFPDCWAHSTLHALMLSLAASNRPVPKFNGVALATLIGRTDGGWSALSAQYVRDNGAPIDGNGPGEWPHHTRRGPADMAALRENMAKYKITEDWMDLGREVWDRNLTEAQSVTCSFNNIPGPEDFNWWGHAVCRVRHVRIERGSWGKLILNSWAGWGRHGLGVLRDSKKFCNGALAVRAVS